MSNHILDLIDAIKAGHLEAIEHLLGYEAVRKEIAAFNNGALRAAAAGGHLEVVEHLLGYEAVRKEIATWGNSILRTAATQGHFEVVKHLLSYEAVRKEIAALNNSILQTAAAGGHLEVVEHLLGYESVRKEIAALNNSILQTAAAGGHLEVVEHLLGYESVRKEIAALHNGALRAASRWGHLKVVKRLLDFEAVQKNIVAWDNGALEAAAAEGRLEVVEHLLGYESVRKEIAALNNSILQTAAAGGHLEVVEHLLGYESVQKEIAASHNRALRAAAAGGHLEIVKYLLGYEAVRKEIAGTLQTAAAGGHLEVVKYLLGYEAVRKEIAALPNEALQAAVEGGHLEVVKYLLGYEAVFRFAEMHEREYEKYINPFVDEQLALLEKEQAAFMARSSGTMFDITEHSQARFYFYLLRNLIRRNAPSLLPQIERLLSIPAVNTLAVHPVTAGESNELLRLALAKGNQTAIECLVCILEVREKAERNDYYRHEMADNEVNMRALAQNPESSIRALTPGQNKKLQAIRARYKQPRFQKVLDDLEKRYLAAPAKVVKNQQTLSLPKDWDAFDDLTKDWPDEERKQALQAYYQHPVHTALRYLSKPNRWIANHAPYVIFNSQNEPYANFGDYKSLIALFWLAAADYSIGDYNNTTAEGRMEHFINELALIGRAHNWDNTRRNTTTGQREEYDDLEGDKPSCYSGVLQRLFQSVLDHPDFSATTMMTTQKLKAEVNDFVRNSFKKKVHNDNRESIRDACNNCLTLLEPVPQSLKELNISQEEQGSLRDRLKQKYGTQFTEDAGANLLLTILFNLNTYRFGVIEETAHILSFYNTANLESLLQQQNGVARPSQAGFFASSSIANETLEDPDQEGDFQNKGKSNEGTRECAMLRRG